jgi:hypothetical protein
LCASYAPNVLAGSVVLFRAHIAEDHCAVATVRPVPEVDAHEVPRRRTADVRRIGGRDENHIALSKRQDPVARRRSFGLSASVVVPREGVDGESNDGPAGDNGECAERFHGRSLGRKSKAAGTDRAVARRPKRKRHYDFLADVGDRNVRLRAPA